MFPGKGGIAIALGAGRWDKGVVEVFFPCVFPQKADIPIAGGGPDNASVVGGGGKAHLLLKRKRFKAVLRVLAFLVY